MCDDSVATNKRSMMPSSKPAYKTAVIVKAIMIRPVLRIINMFLSVIESNHAVYSCTQKGNHHAMNSWKPCMQNRCRAVVRLRHPDFGFCPRACITNETRRTYTLEDISHDPMRPIDVIRRECGRNSLLLARLGAVSP